METINVDQMMVEIRQEVARQVSRRKPKSATKVRFSPNTAALHHLLGSLNHVEAVLNLAESRSHVRTELPDKFQNSPLNAGKKVMLKVFNLAFRDQREVNVGLIQANRHSNQVNRQIIEELVTIRTQLNQIQAQLDHPSQS